MPTMLPARQFSALRLADVLTSSLDAVCARPNTLGLPAVRKAVVILADGLGVSSIRARAGHARFLSSRLNKSSIIDGVFPATTAAGIATLTTGVEPGQHGLVGYQVLDGANDRVVNQLTGWDDGMQPATWQRARTVFDLAADDNVPSFAIGPKRFVASGFTQAVLRGAQYVPAEKVADRFAATRSILNENPTALIYLYVAELDVAAHAHGWESDRWLAQLENLDSEVTRFAATLRSDEGLLLTADHGVIDVPSTKHVLFDTEPALVAGVRHIAGDPRCVQLYLEPQWSAVGSDSNAADTLADAWRASQGDRAWVYTRDEAVAAGLYGRVADEVLPRIGDVLVAARKSIAYYDSRPANQKARGMIGQHGSLTDEEVRVPLIRAGAFAR
ncbi:Type I phosphodiesterase / nucleotide pyrophosphatase [Cryobacterium flavum]|uniref:Type I phosphodiesterase / nucleotide pyrophosphatase n=2 Tax=Cryobacterium flavum TaxID=1424659 RepID=A0A5E9FXF2_9MICO|nr:alkaline phosphatase family protein [Cryobacterium flavum]SDN28209.1 Type I phosphodiesterase / nucleotide pyrophosphatase [Cryobacterium flavum]